MENSKTEHKKIDIIYLSAGSLKEKIWINTHRVGLHLSEHARVLYVENPTNSYWSLLKKLNFKEFMSQIKGIEIRNENLIIVSPMHVLPICFHIGIIKKLEQFLFRSITILRIKQLVKKFQFKNYFLWIYFIEDHYDYIGKLNETEVVYDCVDEISAFPRFDTPEKKKKIIALEQMVLDKTSFVFATTRNLAENKKKFNPGTFYVPNVAEFDMFHKVATDDLTIPEDIQKIQKPVLGYIGALGSYRINFNLINYLSQRYPEWNIVLIGPIGEMSIDNRLMRRDNLTCLGTKAYDQLPNYIKAFDVCLLPYAKNPYTEFSFPLKFWEFMATGKPIVATDIPAFEEFESLIPVCHSNEEFATAVKKCLKEKDPNSPKRIEAAKSNTWQKRIGTMMEHINEYLRDPKQK